MTRIRVNIIMLMCAGYATTFGIFLRLSMVTDPAAALDAVENLMVGLVTGTVAMGHKLLESESADPTRHSKAAAKPPAAPNKRGAQ